MFYEPKQIGKGERWGTGASSGEEGFPEGTDAQRFWLITKGPGLILTFFAYKLKAFEEKKKLSQGEN